MSFFWTLALKHVTVEAAMRDCMNIIYIYTSVHIRKCKILREIFLDNTLTSFLAFFFLCSKLAHSSSDLITLLNIYTNYRVCITVYTFG